MEKQKECMVRTAQGEVSYVLYYKNIKNLNLRVKSDGSVMVSAPFGVPQSYIEAFVRDRALFIQEARRRMMEREKLEMQQRQPDLKLVEEVRLLGKEKKIVICKGKKRVEEYADRILLFATHPDSEEEIRKLYIKWRKKQEEIWLSRIFLSVYDHYFLDTPEEMPLPKLVLRDMKSRWGSCRPYQGVITLNRRLIEYPVEAIEYVVLHEFVHYLEMNHSKNFYQQVEIRMPDYKQRKGLLKRES